MGDIFVSEEFFFYELDFWEGVHFKEFDEGLIVEFFFVGEVFGEDVEG